MRISHRYKFIFFANPKTGSTSIRLALDKFSDISDATSGELAGRLSGRSMKQANDSVDGPPTSKNPVINGMYYGHILPRELEKNFADCGWDWSTYFKFAFVRNPWDRQVSYFCFMVSVAAGAYPWERKWWPKDPPLWVRAALKGSGEPWSRLVLDFARRTKIVPNSDPPVLMFQKEHFLEYIKNKNFLYPQTRFTVNNSGNNLDYIGQLENMQEDFNLICDRIGIPKTILLKKNYVPRLHYRTFYDEEAREIIYDKEKEIIKEYGYAF